MEDIRKLIEFTFGLDISSKSRELRYIEARAAYYTLCWQFTTATKSKIAKSLGKNHATIIHALREFPEMCRINKTLKLRYNLLKEELLKVDIDYKPPDKMNLQELLHAYNMLQMVVAKKNQRINVLMKKLNLNNEQPGQDKETN